MSPVKRFALSEPGILLVTIVHVEPQSLDFRSPVPPDGHVCPLGQALLVTLPAAA